MKPEIFARQKDLIGEGPVWSPSESALYWIDIGQRRLHRKSLLGECKEWTLDERPGCVERLGDGSLILACGHALVRLDPAAGRLDEICKVQLLPGVRFNEGKADPCGRLWFGSMQDNFGRDDTPVPVARNVGALRRLEHNGAVTIVERNIGISNTLAWSPDERCFYFADSLANAIYAYDFDPDTGDITRKRTLFNDSNLGIPDGSAMDIDGCLWNARWGAGLLLRITPKGRLDRIIEMGVPQPASCAFGGANLDTLFVTSARNELSESSLDEAPLSGSVFAISNLAQGTPVPTVLLDGR